MSRRGDMADPTARLRWATLLHSITGWDIFPELSERGYVSRLWAQDWDSAEDSADDAADR